MAYCWFAVTGERQRELRCTTRAQASVAAIVSCKLKSNKNLRRVKSKKEKTLPHTREETAIIAFTRFAY